MRLARAYTALDDLEHYETTRLSIPFRRAITELGERWKDRGVLADSTDIFFLKRETIARLVSGEIEAAIVEREAADHKREYLANRERAPSFTLHESVEEAPPGADTLRGLPGSPGIAEGTVFRLHGVEDFGRFPAGSVLVARTTNRQRPVSWDTPSG